MINRISPRAGLLAEVDGSAYQYGESLTTASLMGNGVIQARTRQQIYQKYQQMIADPVVASALRLHVTAALGGHETSGDLVFIEAKPDADTGKQNEKLIKELSADLTPLFNRIAQTVAYNGVCFGDAYGRIYGARGVGVTDIYVDEMVLPPLVQSYERGNETVVCVLGIGNKMRERLTMNQIARMRLPRMIYTPQPMAVEKAWRVQITEDDQENLPIMPSLVGGSFLAEAETQYNNFSAALGGLVGQRVLDSIDESMFTAQLDGLTKEQSTHFLTSVKEMLSRSKAVADEAVRTGQPVLQRIRHLIPVWREKQVMQVQSVNSSGGTGGGRAGNISIEDVLFHAKLLSGALGIDLTMLGFADMMSGGLGDGGFFRTSAQAAERSRTIRVSLSEFFNHIVDIHVQYKYGQAYDTAKRPWQINFYGSISALETERQKTQLDAFTTGQVLIQTLTMVRDLGIQNDEAAVIHLLEKIMKMDTEAAKLLAKALKGAKPPDQGGGFGDDGAGGGFGAGGDGGDGGGGFGGPPKEPPKLTGPDKE